MMIRLWTSLFLVGLTAPFVAAQQMEREDANSACCPKCQAACVFEATPTQVERKCFEIECKPICVPRVRFPWQKCDEPMRADVKWVKVLTTKKYQCEECKYSWNVEYTPDQASGVECSAKSVPVATPVATRSPVLPHYGTAPRGTAPRGTALRGSARRVSYAPLESPVVLPTQVKAARDAQAPLQVIRVQLRDTAPADSVNQPRRR